jgi:tripartite-type tricarboxylate transporter receptor subunit TctC
MTGAGSLRLAQYLQQAAPTDGLSFGTFDNGLQIAPLLKPETVHFSPSKLRWIGSTAKDQQVCMTWHEFPARTATDLRDREAVFGVTGLDDIRYMSTAMFKNIVGAKIRIVPGYPGSTDIRLAIEKRELDGVCDSWQSLKSTKSEWLENKRVNILVQMTFKPLDELKQVPIISQFAQTDADRAALAVLLAPSESGRSFAAPPTTPPDRLDILRRAFDKSMKDREFLVFAKQARIEVNPLPGEDVEAYIRKVYEASPQDVARARELAK